MPGDPRQCRLHAGHCVEMAAKAATSELKLTFLDLSKQWEQMAVQLETAQALLQDEQIDCKKVGIIANQPAES